MATNELAIIKRDAVDIVEDHIQKLINNGELHLPANYSAENAMKSAWLKLQETKDKSGNLALKVCTKDSIASSLLDMVVQGLNPAKNQCYFIAYGSQLVCQRSYFGAMAVVKRVYPEADIYYDVIYQGDEFEYEINRGRKTITKHVQKIEHVRPDNILAAYCVIEPGDGRPAHTEIMTYDQVKQAWKQGQTNGTSPAHKGFPDQMAMKSAVNRACKAVINSSSDDYLLLTHFNRSDEQRADQELAEDIEQNANGEVIDVEASMPDEPEPEAEPDETPEDEDQEQLAFAGSDNGKQKGPGF